MLDIMLDDNGDIKLDNKGDIIIKDSILQEIKIKIQWFQGEWRWNEEEGLPYYDNLLIKEPDTFIFESAIREKIFDIDGIVSVDDINIYIDSSKRTCKISFVAETDYETFRDEVSIKWANMV